MEHPEALKASKHVEHENQDDMKLLKEFLLQVKSTMMLICPEHLMEALFQISIKVEESGKHLEICK